MNLDKYILTLCKRALLSSNESGTYSSSDKNKVLRSISENIHTSVKKIISANQKDVDEAKKSGIPDSMIDRLVLNEERITSMRDGLKKIISIPDTLYKSSNCNKQLNGISVSQMRVPLGVIGMIYESRPNVTIDAAGLCIKSGNSVILRGGSESINSNKELMNCIKKSLKDNNIHPHAVQLIETTDRKAINLSLIHI